MRSLRYIFLFILGISIFACNNAEVHSEYASFDKGWAKSDVQKFKFEAPDTSNTYNVFLNTRLNQEYLFSNLFLITKMNFPNGKIVSDTLAYEMAYPNGELMGQGFGSVKESKLWYKNGVKFDESGEYTLEVQQAMRKFGEVQALDTLSGILDFGFSIEVRKNN
ncbi:MAG: gliding motility lipoprotein GldH [Psychroflexus sp.]